MAAQVDINYEAGITANAGNSDLAPHYILANQGGTVTQQYGTQLHGALWHAMDTTVRLSWGAGIEAWGGWTSNATYYNNYYYVEEVTEGDHYVMHHYFLWVPRTRNTLPECGCSKHTLRASTVECS